MEIIIIFMLLAFLIIVSLSFRQYVKKTQQEQEKEKLNTESIQREINQLSEQKSKLLQDIAAEKQKIEQIYKTEKQKIYEQIELYKENTSYASEQYVAALEKQYDKVEQEYHRKIQILKEQEQEQKESIQKYVQKIDDLKNILNAGARAQLREREKEEQLSFYKLSLSERELEDILQLNSLKMTLHDTTILSKLIWTTYFQKQTTDMCNRILGTAKVCGIYKITNIKTQQCYIGQSVDVAQRWKDHVKCGLGIDASVTNKLYNAMQRDGAWNFTFELLESCNRSQLNEKETFWIDMYDAYNLGYNSTRGNK